ncbi:hypothetical protein NMY22_g8945 [Coprinellus aureogranulatus]|nr:hypothetical protein NMY22_g8945 [Coprinellus aureogranulatus]
MDVSAIKHQPKIQTGALQRENGLYVKEIEEVEVRHEKFIEEKREEWDDDVVKGKLIEEPKKMVVDTQTRMTKAYSELKALVDEVKKEEALAEVRMCCEHLTRARRVHNQDRRAHRWGRGVRGYGWIVIRFPSESQTIPTITPSESRGAPAVRPRWWRERLFVGIAPGTLYLSDTRLYPLSSSSARRSAGSASSLSRGGAVSSAMANARLKETLPPSNQKSSKESLLKSAAGHIRYLETVKELLELRPKSAEPKCHNPCHHLCHTSVTHQIMCHIYIILKP